MIKLISLPKSSLKLTRELIVAPFQIHFDCRNTSGGAASRGLLSRMVQGHQHELCQGAYLHGHQFQHIWFCRSQAEEGRARWRPSVSYQEAPQMSSLSHDPISFHPFPYCEDCDPFSEKLKGWLGSCANITSRVFNEHARVSEFLTLLEYEIVLAWVWNYAHGHRLQEI